MTEPDVRDLLALAAGTPEPGPLLLRVRRQARRARRRRAALALAAVVGLTAVTGGTVAALHGTHGSHVRRGVLSQASQSPSPVRTTGPSASPTRAAAEASAVASLKPSAGETFSATNLSGTGTCSTTQLSVGQAADVHVLAGEEAMDLPLQAVTPCVLGIGDFSLAPDAEVPVTSTAATRLTIAPHDIVHLTLTGESDGFCRSVPDAKRVTVELGGRLLTTVHLPSDLGLCTGITARVQQASLGGGETPACSATSLTGFPLPTETGNGTEAVNVLLRNDSHAVCYLGGYPAELSAVTVAGTVADLPTTIGTSAANGSYLEPGAFGFVSIRGLDAISCTSGVPAHRGPFATLTLGLEAGGKIPVTFAGAPVSLPCGPLASTAFQPAPAGSLGPTLSVVPRTAAVGGTVTASGRVGNVSLCPVVDVTAAADGATGAGGNFRVPVSADPIRGGGTFSLRVPVPAARDASDGVGTAAAIRAFCDRADGSATNAGDSPEVDVTRT